MSSSTNVHYQGADFRVSADNLTGWRDTYTLSLRDGSHDFTGFFNLEQLQQVADTINGLLMSVASDKSADEEARALAEFDSYQESLVEL